MGGSRWSFLNRVRGLFQGVKVPIRIEPQGAGNYVKGVLIHFYMNICSVKQINYVYYTPRNFLNFWNVLTYKILIIELRHSQ